MADCHCGLKSEYEECCGRYIEKGAKAPTAEALMRSRYSAYATGKAEYIVKTALYPPDIEDLYAFMKEIEFYSLTVLQKKGGGVLDKKGTVEFAARYVKDGKDAKLHEISKFVRKRGEWLYDESGSRIVE